MNKTEIKFQPATEVHFKDGKAYENLKDYLAATETPEDRAVYAKVSELLKNLKANRNSK